MKQKIRIAAGQGFWGDLPEAPVRQVQEGPVDYLMLDYLAEVTMSIMQKQKARDPKAGYARDFVPLMRQILPACVERNIRVTANAGGVNVEGCAKAVRDVALDLGLAGKLRIALLPATTSWGNWTNCSAVESSCATWTLAPRCRLCANEFKAR